VKEPAGNGIATCDAAIFDRMLAEHRPDAVIVTVPDYRHHEHIEAALRAGCDAISGKPVTTDPGKPASILAARAPRGGR